MKRKNRFFAVIASLFLAFACFPSLLAQKVYKTETHTTDYGLEYTTVTNDPLKARIYTLSNGMKLYLTQNENEPRIMTYVAVGTGSKDDPADATGLAHYLEHLLFKGTDRFGSMDFEKEKQLLAEIEALYEKHRSVTDPEQRKTIYKEIDKVSGAAAKFAIANEYDKVMSVIGAKYTNAFTSFEQTGYMNDIPSNQLEKWMMIESERYRNPVFRLFHTELEAVYEEKNISLDDDFDRTYDSLFAGLFPSHNYGQQTTIGTIEHLKNPSIKKIREFYEQWYKPNNMAICLSGELDPDKTAKLAEKYFGKRKAGELPRRKPVKEAPLIEPVEKEVFGPESEKVLMGFRFPGARSEDARTLELIDMILANSTAGLIDLNLNQQQRVLEASSFVWGMNDYSVHLFEGAPREDQTLEQVRDLLLEQIELVKKGAFDDFLLEAVINDLEFSAMRGYQNNFARSGAFLDAFISQTPWEDHVKKLDELRKITKEQLVSTARKYYGDNYVVVYKRNGEKGNTSKVEKPQITPVEMNREAQSKFLKDLIDTPTAPATPRFLDYQKDIRFAKTASGIPVHYLKNTENSLFSLYYVLDMGKNHDKKLPVAIKYLSFLGTDKYSAEEIKKEFYKIGCKFNVNAGNDRVWVVLNGLEKNFDKGVELFEHLLTNAQPDEKALKNMTDGILKSRGDAKLDKRRITGGLRQFGTYGPKSPFNDVLSNDAIQKLSAKELTDRIHQLTSFEHRILYYGPHAENDLLEKLGKMHSTPSELKKIPAATAYTYVDNPENTVYFLEYDMVQAEVFWLSRSVEFNTSLHPTARLFNEYYGGSMSSIVFQTLRESKALAYGTWSGYNSPSKKGDPFTVFAYIGTQADKLHEAMEGMFELLREIPRADKLLEGSKAAIRNQIETERITRAGILFNYERAKNLGVDSDLRKLAYERIPEMKFEDIEAFHNKYISGQKYNILIMGSKKNIDLKSLEKYGTVKMLTLEEVFGH